MEETKKKVFKYYLSLTQMKVRDEDARHWGLERPMTDTRVLTNEGWLSFSEELQSDNYNPHANQFGEWPFYMTEDPYTYCQDIKTGKIEYNKSDELVRNKVKEIEQVLAR
ncbi:MAG: hypothetical protein LBG88_03060 [Christensenellaceae bacterium]|jgi:hypothetical protein|nr:hypothetical protein [Christensenellaceae bacterium]